MVATVIETPEKEVELIVTNV